jgi:NADPH2 dehydrogenase/chanoclavine-I aldehyde reductase
MTKDSKLFKSIRVGPCNLHHRVVMAPLTRLRADDLYVQLPFVKDYYGQRASVPGTLIIAEATAISPQAVGFSNTPGIWSTDQIRAWTEVTECVHRKGSYIFLQLWACGRAAEQEALDKDGIRFVSSSATAADPDQRCPHPLTEEEIQSYITDFATAARNAITAGFDGVEIHGAHGFLIDQFTQEICNKRTDQWGGSIENRSRFALDVTKAVVDAVGADRVGIKLSPWAEEFGMKMTRDIIPQFEFLIKALAGLQLAYLTLSNPRWEQGDLADDKDYNGIFVRAWGKSRPVILCGGYTQNSARLAVDEQYAEYQMLIAFGRFFISTPDLPFRAKKGLEFSKYNRDTFYTPCSKAGYIDYPFSEEFVAQSIGSVVEQ